MIQLATNSMNGEWVFKYIDSIRGAASLSDLRLHNLAFKQFTELLLCFSKLAMCRNFSVLIYIFLLVGFWVSH